MRVSAYYLKGWEVATYRRISARPHQRKGEPANLYNPCVVWQGATGGKVWPEAKQPNKEHKNFATIQVSRELCERKREQLRDNSIFRECSEFSVRNMDRLN